MKLKVIRLNRFLGSIINKRHWLTTLVLLLLMSSDLLSQQYIDISVESRKINDSEIPEYSVTPDSSYKFFGQWLGDSLGYQLFSRNLKNGDTVALTKGPGSVGKAIMSPSGKLIAYEWTIDDKFTELRIVNIDGSKPRVLYSDSIYFSMLQEWSPDEKYIAAMAFNKNRTFKALLIPISNDSLIVVRKQQFPSMNWGFQQSKMSFSYDSKFIAYDISTKNSWYNRDIFLRPETGGNEVPIIQDPANDLLIGWTPDAKAILFASDRSGRWDLWTIKVLNGKPNGKPKLIKANIGSPINVVNFTKDGILYYKKGVHEKFDLSVATLDAASKKIIETKVLSSHIGFNSAVQWSRNGKYLAYAWGLGSGYEPLTLAIRSDKSGKEHLIILDKLMRHGGHGFEPQWSPDGRHIIATARVRDYNGPGMDSQGLYQIDTETGSYMPIKMTSGICGLDCYMTPLWLSDGRIIFERRLTTTLIIKSLKTGEEKELYQQLPPGLLRKWPTSCMAISSDDKQLAFVQAEWKNDKWINALMVLQTSGGEPKELFRTSPGVQLSVPAWMPDSRHIIFALSSPDEVPGFELVRIAANGGKPEKLGLNVKGVVPYGLSVHPDGRRIVFTSGKEIYYREETWVLKNFLHVDSIK